MICCTRCKQARILSTWYIHRFFIAPRPLSGSLTNGNIHVTIENKEISIYWSTRGPSEEAATFVNTVVGMHAHQSSMRPRIAGQIIISGILPVFGNKIQGYRNSKRMAVNGMVERLCKEEDVGYMDLWDSFVGNEDMYVRDGLHLSGKGAAVFAEGLSGAVASGLGKVRYLN